MAAQHLEVRTTKKKKLHGLTISATSLKKLVILMPAGL